MARFDRYMLSQLMVLFGFFALVLVAIFWINSAARLFDRLIADGQSTWVFLQYTILSLPQVIRRILPMAAFAAAVYVTNRLTNESELVVMQATGFSPWRLARPVFVFGLLVALMMTVLTHLLVPISMQQLTLKQEDVARNVTAKLLTEGTFLHPTEGVTFYIRSIDPDGTLNDVFLSDRRDPDEVQTFTANRAYLINAAEAGDEGPRPRLVMVEGLAQSLDRRTEQLYTTHFEDFSYDISRLIDRDGDRRPTIYHLSTFELLSDPSAAAERTGSSLGRVLEEGHTRIEKALMCIVGALIGFAMLLTGQFNRFGVVRQIVAAFVLLVCVSIIEGAAEDALKSERLPWPVIYVPILVGFSTAGFLLAFAGRSRRVGPAIPDEGPSETAGSGAPA